MFGLSSSDPLDPPLGIKHSPSPGLPVHALAHIALECQAYYKPARDTEAGQAAPF